MVPVRTQKNPAVNLQVGNQGLFVLAGDVQMSPPDVRAITLNTVFGGEIIGAARDRTGRKPCRKTY